MILGHEKYGDSNGLLSKSLVKWWCHHRWPRPRCQSATSQVPFVCSAAIDQHCDVLHARVLEMRSMMTWYSHGIWENGFVSETPATMFGFIRMMVRRYWPPTTTYLRANLKHVSCWGSHCTGGWTLMRQLSQNDVWIFLAVLYTWNFRQFSHDPKNVSLEYYIIYIYTNMYPISLYYYSIN